MPNEQGKAKAPWHLESFRLTAFLSSPVDDAEAHWLAVLDAPPDRVATQRVGGNTLHLAEDEHPDFGRIGLQVDGTKTKVDWLLGQISLVGAEQRSPVGPLLTDDLWRQLRTFCENWSSRYTEPTKRLAIGATLLGAAHSDRGDGYRALAPFIPAVELDPESSDFQYRINRPRPSRTLPTTINRVMHWSVAALFEAKAEVTKGDLQSTVSFRPRVQLDVNTATEYTEGIQDAKAVFGELLNNVQEVSKLGDVK